MPRHTVDPRTGRGVAWYDDYDYTNDPLANDPYRLEPNDAQSIHVWQMAENAAGRPAYLSPWQNLHHWKWWLVPEEEQAELMEAETVRLGGQEIIETKLTTDRSLFRGSPGQVPTPWDGNIGDTANWGNIITNTRIGIQWLRLQPAEIGRGSQMTKTIGLIMRRLGWTMRKQRVPGMESIPYVWTKPEVSRNTIEEDAGTVQQAISTDDDDIPF